MTSEVDTADAVGAFPEASRALLAEWVTGEEFAGVIPAAGVRVLGDVTGLTPQGLLPALVPLARSYAHPPISSYRAGAVILGASGSLILGANLEFPGLALNATVHAEQAAALRAHQLGERQISALAVGGNPCGHCRQFLSEANNPALEIITPAGARPLAEMLPDAFSPRTLGNEQGMYDVMPQPLDLDEGKPDELTAAALEAARRSYAPYSGNYAGAAVRVAGGEIFSASYLENVAFNPSLSPLQGVLIAMRMRRVPWSAIRRAVLVERRAQSSQEPATRALLATLVGVELVVSWLEMPGS